MSFPRYESYKDSGVEWLGDVPEHWHFKPLWTLFRRTKRVGYEDETLLSVYRDYGVIPKSSRDDNNNKPSEDLSPYQLVKVGDLAINKMKAWQGSVAISDYQGIVSPAYFVYESTNSEHSKYLHYLLRSPQYITGYLSVSKGIRVNQWDLDPQYHSRLPVLIPQYQEQLLISQFLNQETAKIDNLIAEQERLIALLKEKRQAVISHAVTKGLNPDVPMKDSGVEWLGEVPEHWLIIKISHAFNNIGSGTTPKSDEQLFYEDGVIPWLNTGDLNDGVLESCKNHITEMALDTFTTLKQYPSGSVVIAMYGATIGKLCIIGFETTVNQACCVFSESNSIENKFLFYWLMGVRQNIVGLAVGGGQPNINQEILKSLRIPCPDRLNQLAICQFLDQETAKIDNLIAESTNVISLLKERRSALISSAVTGKIDVRNFVPSQPNVEVMA